MATFHYVYILTSERDPNHHYTGRTSNLTKRLHAHNSGQLPSTAEHKPWHIEMAIAFRSPQKAAKFEHYLKTHSGRAFASKHF